MRILLDECVPKRLAKFLKPHETFTVVGLGWSGKKNGGLLAAMQEIEINVLLTVDKNLQFQQNLSKYLVAVILMDARSNRFRDLVPFVPQILDSLLAIRLGEVIQLLPS